ncbi:MAG: CAP domain-containing protein [Candidatus Pacebacteria bacterium]|nr:CAP domain-containing protein [Candidatus Paceibacterota bacterium]
MKVITVLKHMFIPHEHNEYKPHFFREVSVLILFAIILFALGASFGSYFFIHRTVMGAEIAASVLIDLTNEDRIASNQPALLRNSKLDTAAQLKGEDMVSKQYFSHDSPEGVTPWFWFRKVGYNFLYAGENLAINFTDAKDVEEAWLNSPKHRANIMNVQFREIGMATVQGFYNNYPTIYIVQMFGTPAYGKTTKEVAVIQNTKKEGVIQIDETVPSKTSTTSLNGDVKGDIVKNQEKLDQATGTVATTTTITKEDVLSPIVNTQEIAIVKNIDAEEKMINENSKVAFYSKWYQRFIFNAPYYVQVVYKVLVAIIGAALLVMIFVEIKKQHYKHILYGVLLLILLVLFLYINQSFY